MPNQQKAGYTRVEADIPNELAGRFAIEAVRRGMSLQQLVGMAAVAGAFGMMQAQPCQEHGGTERDR